MADVLAEAYVRLRALNDGSFEKDAHATIVPSLGRIAGDAGRVMAGVKLFGFAKEGIAELGDAEKAAAQTAAVIQSTGGVANVTAGHVDDLANSLLKLSGKDDEAIKGGENLLLTFKNIRNEAGAGNDIFDQTTKAALDLSVAFGQDMKSSALQLGKALDDPVRGLTALQRIGVRFSADQVDLIKNLVASGKQLEAQKVILKEVESQVGGSAKAYGETLPGQLERAQESMKNAKAALVGGLAPAMEIGANSVVFLAEKVQELPKGAQQALGAIVLLTGGVLSLARPVSDIVGLYSRWKAASQAATVAEIAEAEAAGVDAAAQSADAAAKELNTGASIGLVAGLGAAAAAAALTVIAIDGLSHAGEVHVNVQKAATLSTAELVDGFRKLGNSTDGFRTLAEGSIGTAQRLRDAIAAEGGDVSKLDPILADVSRGHKQLATDQATNTDSTDKLAGSTKTLAQSMDESKAAIQRMQAAQLGYLDSAVAAFQAAIQLQDAQIRTRSSLEEYTKATKDHTLSEDELTSKRDSALTAIIAESSAAGDLAQKQAGLTDATDVAGVKQKALVEELIKVRDSLAPGSPLRMALQGYIDTLAAMPRDVTTHLHVQADGNAVVVGGGTHYAAAGFDGIVDRPTTFVAGEGGAPERVHIGPVDEYARAMVASAQRNSPTPAASVPGFGSAGDVHVTVHVHAPNYIGSHNDLVAALADPHGPIVEAVSEGLRRRDKGMR